MKESIKNIFNLSKLYIKENNNDFKFIDWDSKKINKKSALFWAYVVLVFALVYLSIEVVDYFRKTGKPEIFLNIYFVFIQILVILRTTILSINVFFFSQEIENILHLPFKPIEILVSKFTCILFMNYEIEILFGLIPLFIYGNQNNVDLFYFVRLILVLLLFPVFWTIGVSLIMMILMRFTKIFKSKNTMQIVVSLILIIPIMIAINIGTDYVFNNLQYIEENQQQLINTVNDKLTNINTVFLNINPSINLLLSQNGFINLLKLIVINSGAILIFVIIGSKIYLSQLLKSNFYTKKRIRRQRRIKSKKRSIGIAYIKKEVKLLLKNPLFLMQTIYPVILMTITVTILIFSLTPQVREILQKEEFKEQLQNMKFNIEAVCIIVGLIQIVGLTNYTSITAFSREGKNAYVIKYLPISLYKQFIYKNIPQIIVNIVCAVPIFVAIHMNLPEIKMVYLAIMYVISVLLIIINSVILTLIDLTMPKLEWDAEYEILKNNKNKMLQYVLMVLNVLFLIFINKLFKGHNLDKSIAVFIISLIIIFILINYLISKYKQKLFKKIN